MKEPQRWEYTVLQFRNLSPGQQQDELLHYGHEGWELVTVSNGLAYLRRPWETEE